jgi:hypothetical protein
MSFFQIHKKKVVSTSLEVIEVDYQPQEIEMILRKSATLCVDCSSCQHLWIDSNEDYFIEYHFPSYETNMVNFVPHTEQEKKIDQVD